MGKSVHVQAPPPGFKLLKIGKTDPVPGGALPAKDTSGLPVKRCYYIPEGGYQSQPMSQGIPSYLAGTVHDQNAYPGSAPQQAVHRQAPPGAEPAYPQQQPPPGQARGGVGGPWAEVVGRGYTHPSKVKYEFKESAVGFTDGDAKVYHFGTEKEAFSIRGTHFRDYRGGHRVVMANGQEVCQVGKSQGFDVKKMIKKEFGLAKSSLCIFDMSNNQIASVAEKMWTFGADSTLTMKDGREVELKSSGLRAKEFKCSHNGRLLFTVEHKTSAKSLLLGKDNYHITVEPNVDSLLAVCVCLILEDLFRGEK